MKIADIKALPEGTPLRTTRGDIVTLAGTTSSRAVVRDSDGQTHEYAGVSLHTTPDPYPLITGLRKDLTGRTITVERATRTAARSWRASTPDWEALIGRRCVVERENGRFRKVVEIEDGVHLRDAEELAALTARQSGARYVPAGGVGKGETMETRPVTAPASMDYAAAPTGPASPAVARSSFGKRIEIDGHIYTVMGGSPSPYLLHRGPVEPVDPRVHRCCGSDCTVRGF